MTLTICTWLWGNKYSEVDVERLRIGVSRHLHQPYRFVCITDRHHMSNLDTRLVPVPQEDRLLLQYPGCLARLRMFDPAFQEVLGVEEKLVNLDIDMVITGTLDPLFERDEPFCILQGANAANPCPFNGSIFMLRNGAHREVFDTFSIDASRRIMFYEFPDDQGWMLHKVPNAAGWQVGLSSGIYAFQKPGWPRGSVDLPKDARMVVFPGWRSPKKFEHLSWVYSNWTSLSSYQAV